MSRLNVIGGGSDPTFIYTSACLALAGQVNFQGNAVYDTQDDRYSGLREIEIFKSEGGGSDTSSLTVLCSAGDVPCDRFGDIFDGEITGYLK